MQESNLAWAPNEPLPGCRASSQELFLVSPHVETLIEGGRGSGKTTALLADFHQGVGLGWGSAWVGILFRRNHKDLKDVLSKSEELFLRLRPRPRFYYSASDYYWEWPAGERLYLRHLDQARDCQHFQGHQYPWQGWEELTTWPDLDCYQTMVACLRSTHPEVAKNLRRRATTNPWGPGHAAVKAYFIDGAPSGRPQMGEGGDKRVSIYAPLAENKPLISVDPHYMRRTVGGLKDPNLKQAWGGGPKRWLINAGSYFADCWRPEYHVVPAWKPPLHWRVSLGFDWGSSAPFSCGWYAESPGETVAFRNGRAVRMPKGTLVRFAEWYGSSGKNKGLQMLASDVAKGINQRSESLGYKVSHGVADSSMWAADGKPSLAAEFIKLNLRLDPCKKGPGSRVDGWHKCRAYLAGSVPKYARDGAELPLEDPGFYVTESCSNFIKEIPELQRDPDSPDDIMSDKLDHIADEWRYRLNWTHNQPAQSRALGGFG